MTVYVYRCGQCGREADETHPIGEQPSTGPCVECGGLARQVLGVGLYIGADALPNKRHGVRSVNARERRWDRDMPAYKRMADRGLQPRQIDGSGNIENRVGDQADIDYRLHQLPDSARDIVKEQTMETVETLTPMVSP